MEIVFFQYWKIEGSLFLDTKYWGWSICLVVSELMYCCKEYYRVTAAFQADLDSCNFFVSPCENVGKWVDDMTTHQRPHNNSESDFSVLEGI